MNWLALINKNYNLFQKTLSIDKVKIHKFV